MKSQYNSQLVAIVSYLQVVDDGDGVPVPADDHGANLAPGSVLRIELQDVVHGAAHAATCPATCIVLYYYTNCMGNNANDE